MVDRFVHGPPNGSPVKGIYDYVTSPRHARHILDGDEPWSKKLLRREKFLSKYTLGRELGRGQFGVTYVCTEKSTGRDFACKCIRKSSMSSEVEVEYVRVELGILHLFAEHPHFVQLEAAYEDQGYIYIVMELCKGGPLLERIIEKGFYTEASAAKIFQTVMTVVQECHAYGVMHRDLKPENFLFLNTSEDSSLKAIDFGLSALCPPNEKRYEFCGSPCYIAPEILRPNSEEIGYTTQVDVWSAGIILYLLLSGQPPFWGHTRDLEWEILNLPVNLRSQPWGQISNEAKDLISHMLVRDPDARYTPAQVMNHPWIAMSGVARTEPLNLVVERLQKFATMNKLKRAAFNYIARNLSREEIMGLKEMFHQLDKDKSGTISLEELRKGLQVRGLNLSEAEAGVLLRAADSNEDGVINYEEFLTATLHMSKLIREDRILSAFKHFDRDDSGFLSPNEILQALREHSIPVDFEGLYAIMEKFDDNRDGLISFDEFVRMMRSMESDNPPPASGRIRRRGNHSIDSPVLARRPP